MGALQSRTDNFQSKNEGYQLIIDSIESEHPVLVHRNLKKHGDFTTKEQLEAVSIIIYEKAVLNPHLSLKCAQLVKQIEAETVFENDKKFIFHSTFNQYLMKLVHSIIDNYDESKMTDHAVERGKRIATFIGHLFNVDSLGMTLLIEIGQAAKKKKTKSNNFFINTIWNVVAESMFSTHSITFEIFDSMISDPIDIRNRNSNLDLEYNAAKRFCGYLQKINAYNHYEYYGHFDDFKYMEEETLKVAVTSFLGHAVAKPDFINVYCEIALEIYNIQPCETKTILINFLIENSIANSRNDKSSSFYNLLNMIIEFSNIGLIGDSILDKFLNISKSSRIPIEIFNYLFVGVLTKYRGQFLQRYFEHFKKCTDAKLSKLLIPAIQQFIQCRDLQMGKKRINVNACERTVADFPDFHEYASKCQTLKAAFDSNNSQIQPTFICEDRLSCQFAALRGIEIFKRHIGNKFFTPERIEICSKMTKKATKVEIGSSIDESLCRECKTYLPYFNGTKKSKTKVANFSNLLASFYNDKLINHNLVITWLTLLSNGLSSEPNSFQEIFSEFYAQISTKLENENRYACKIYFNLLKNLTTGEIGFNDFVTFKEICSRFNNFEANAIDLLQLKKITIPNLKSAMILVSKHLLSLFTHKKISGPVLVQIISVLSTLELDKNLLRSEFQDILCITFGQSCAGYKDVGERTYTLALSIIDMIEALCVKTFITRLGLANLLHIMVDILDLNPYPIPKLMNRFNQQLSQFFLGTKALPTKVEKIIIDVRDKMINALKIKDIDSEKVNEVIASLDIILDKSRQKREQDEAKKSFKADKNKDKSSDSDSSSSSPANQTIKDDSIASKNSTEQSKRLQKPNISPDESNSVISCNLNVPTTSTAIIQDVPAIQKEPETQNNLTDQQSTSTKPKITQEDIKDYQDYCNYFDSIEPKTSDDDKFFFDSVLISTIRITEKEQVIDLVKKFIERVQAGQSTIIFFIQNVQKIGNAIQNIFKLQKQKVSFQKLLIDEIFLKFENQERLLEFMCELYNNSFVNKTAMIAFVDKFKSQSPENIILMHKFVKTCAIRLSSQGDKEQLMQIRTIARTVKNLPNYDEDLKYQAQDLANSINSLIQLLDNGQIKPQILTESPEKLIEDLMKNVLKNPQIYVKTACRLDGKLKDLLIHNIEKIIKEVPKFVIKPDEFMNLLEFIAELYNLDFLKHEFLSWTIEIFLQSSTNEICSQSIEFLFMKCGQKMENENKHKLDIYMKYFEAVLAQDIKNIQSECFKRIQKLKNRKWKILNIPENFYEDFLMLFSMNDANVVELLDIFKVDEEEIDKFIQILWKIILKDQPHPTYSILCLEISKSCKNFGPKLTAFLTARCITFIGLNSDMFNENVKERLGKVITFVADIYNNNLVSDQALEAFLDSKLTSKLPSEFVTRIFSILSKCQRLNESRNERLKTLVKDFDNIYHQGVSAQMESIINGLKSIDTNVN
ncbi:hypothetical protein ACKWTF_016040 [Chironomus riparius]